MANKTKIERVPTGVPGFDNLIEGGFPRNSSVLLVGGPGTCKSIFCLQYLHNGIDKKKENGIYITFEESRKDLVEQAEQFGWDMEKLEKEGKITFFEMDSREISKNVFEEMHEIVKKNNVKRVVVDSLSDVCFLTTLSSHDSPEPNSDIVTNEYQVSRIVQKLIKEIEKFGCTNLFISDSIKKGKYMTRDGISEFVSDGVIEIEFQEWESETPRTLRVIKMRKTKVSFLLQSINVTEKGLVVSSLDKQ